MDNRKPTSITTVKTFRFPVKLMDDVSLAVHLNKGKNRKESKYPTMTAFFIEALKALVEKERKIMEEHGVAWDYVTPEHK